ncbi:RNA-directed DNA polymerase from mobile element jockey [Eumeta japonica]|uniref:RNA-directed DNA polymerase from mobile element jockey n=1 Tax=Eumeta variegata TaxID=151549 RepID=A0A4C1Z4F6_EUMVA|nr:RNA-directed DNA polymerase from mobile element jockey [Eumeta japonica]
MGIEDNQQTQEIIDPISETEVQRHIKALKTDKSPGPDNLTNETLKIGAPLLIPYLKLLFNEVVESEQVPDQWRLSQIILLYKKGNPLEVGNYRPISLLPSIYKLFSSILLSRIAPQIDKNQPIEQAGFRPNYSTNDHIHAVDQLIENTKNSTNHSTLERKGEEFPIERGVKQGDPLSPKLFIAVLQDIFRNIDWADKGILVLNERLTHLRFADDIAMFSETATGLEQMFQNLASESNKVGLEMNTSKTKIMTNSIETPISIEGQNIEYVKEYIYLGKLTSFHSNRNENRSRQKSKFGMEKLLGTERNPQRRL